MNTDSPLLRFFLHKDIYVEKSITKNDKNGNISLTYSLLGDKIILEERNRIIKTKLFFVLELRDDRLMAVDCKEYGNEENQLYKNYPFIIYPESSKREWKYPLSKEITVECTSEIITIDREKVLKVERSLKYHDNQRSESTDTSTELYTENEGISTDTKKFSL